MKREIIPTTHFSKIRDSLLKKGQLLQEDYNGFIETLAENPDLGDVMTGTGGIRKTRLKSASKGKSSGFRICYYYFHLKEQIYLLDIFGKNEQENLTEDEKKTLRNLAHYLKRGGTL